jgi:hypothetical protein
METMALKGKPRDMNEWREALPDPSVDFPGASSEYRRARNEPLEAEAGLRRLNEQLAAQRRALPAGGLIREDYVFESAADGSKVRLSELFAPGRNSLVIYNMMFPRWSEDPRAGAPEGRTAELPLVEQPCPSCTSVVDGVRHRWPEPYGDSRYGAAHHDEWDREDERDPEATAHVGLGPSAQAHHRHHVHAGP